MRTRPLFYAPKALAIAIGLLIGPALWAQLQDDCLNAGVIPIGAGGYGIGTYSTAPAAINTATVQPGEFFSYAPLLSGRSLWCRFTLPTPRRVTLQLSTTGIGNNSDVGWTCYRVNSPADCLPGYNEAQAAFFTPMQSTSSSIVACLPPGEYLVQVTANAGVGTGAVIMNLTTELPDAICDPFAGMSSASIGGAWVNVWPNPSHGEFMLEGTDLGRTIIRVTDAAGREIAISRTHCSSASTVVDLGNAPSGLYVLHVIGIDETWMVPLFIER